MIENAFLHIYSQMFNNFFHNIHVHIAPFVTKKQSQNLAHILLTTPTSEGVAQNNCILTPIAHRTLSLTFKSKSVKVGTKKM